MLSNIASAVASRHDINICVVATNMHLSPRYGNTIDEIRADGFEPVSVTMDVDSDSPEGKVHSMAQCLDGMTGAFASLQPDMMVILGDRFEMLAAATAALMMRIPIIHIAGGEISEGAVDDSIRHAITKMASLHLTATEPYRRRVIAMGEMPERVINTGAIGVWNLLNGTCLTREELSQSIGFDIDNNTLLVTYHPVTLDDNTTSRLTANLLRALEQFTDNKILFTYPNNDAGGRVIIDMIDRFVSENPGRAFAVASLGRKRYLSALKCVAAVVGNSSSGIVEVPSAGIPTVDIGMRQQGRLRGQSVIHAEDDPADIARAINQALSAETRAAARVAVNPYCSPDTLSRIVNAIATADPARLRHKKFHDILPLQ